MLACMRARVCVLACVLVCESTNTVLGEINIV